MTKAPSATADQDEALANDLNDDAAEQKAASADIYDPSKPLWPPRRELFAQLMFGGYPPVVAYEQAGYKRSPHNASRMQHVYDVRARIEWLMQSQSDRNQRQMARAIGQKAYSEVIALEEAEMVRARAMFIDKLHTALQATALKCRVTGLLTDSDGRRDRPLSDMTLEELEKSVVGLSAERDDLDGRIQRKLAGLDPEAGVYRPPSDGKVH